MTTTQGLEPTQTRRPWRATIRTAFAVGVPAILLLPTIIQIVVDELGPNLPDRYTGWLIAAGAIVTALAAAITRIMALPAFELFARKLPGAILAAQPTPKPDDQGDDRGRADVAFTLLVAFLALVAFIVIVRAAG